jgi:hypothetical protein
MKRKSIESRERKIVQLGKPKRRKKQLRKRGSSKSKRKGNYEVRLTKKRLRRRIRKMPWRDSRLDSEPKSRKNMHRFKKMKESRQI